MPNGGHQEPHQGLHATYQGHLMNRMHFFQLRDSEHHQVGMIEVNKIIKPQEGSVEKDFSHKKVGGNQDFEQYHQYQCIEQPQ